jgi:hypothetical protein
LDTAKMIKQLREQAAQIAVVLYEVEKLALLEKGGKRPIGRPPKSISELSIRSNRGRRSAEVAA